MAKKLNQNFFLFNGHKKAYYALFNNKLAHYMYDCFSYQ